MHIPFTIEQFLANFSAYNQHVFPMQVIFYLLAITAIYLVIKNNKSAGKFTIATISFLWLWMGIVYHFIFFTVINKAAYLFGTIFITEAILLFYFGIIKSKLSFRLHADVYGITGTILILFALLFYPIIGYAQGHIYPSSPTFGLPCPTTIFTFGILLWSERKIPFSVLIIPMVWSVIGFSAAFSLGIREDAGLVIAGLLGTGMVIRKNRSLG